MTKPDLDQIEHTLGFALPEFYKRFMLDYPPELLSAKPDGWSPITDWEFADNPRRLIEMNQHVRAQPDGHFVEGGPWPDRYFVIGEEDGGNYYAIDRFSGDETVFMFHHESGDIGPLFTKSLDEFRDWMIEYFDQFK